MNEPILLRISKRRTSWEEPDVETILRVEFSWNSTPELNVSVYEIPDNDTNIVRAYAEHVVGARLDPPPKPSKHMDAQGPDVMPISVSGPGPFAFIRDAHREIEFEDEGELRAFIAAIRDQVSARTRKADKSDVRQYIKQRLADDDPEWTSALNELPKWNVWAAR